MMNSSILFFEETHTIIKACSLLGVLDDERHFFEITKKVEKVLHDQRYKILYRLIHPKVWEHVKHLSHQMRFRKN